MASLAEWFVRASRGTSGDMVLDILYDWKNESKRVSGDISMKEIMEKVKQLNRILTGEEGPKLTLNYAEDARYTYPEQIALALKILAEMEYLINHFDYNRTQN